MAVGTRRGRSPGGSARGESSRGARGGRSGNGGGAHAAAGAEARKKAEEAEAKRKAEEAEARRKKEEEERDAELAAYYQEQWANEEDGGGEGGAPAVTSETAPLYGESGLRCGVTENPGWGEFVLLHFSVALRSDGYDIMVI
jgi:nucleobase transporter 1/2